MALPAVPGTQQIQENGGFAAFHDKGCYQQNVKEEINMAIDYEKLKKIACEIRVDIIKQTYHAGSGHPGGSLSAADILTVLYFHEMNVDPADPRKADRDKFVLSKGHASPVLYAALAQKGFFPKEDLVTFRKLGSKLQGHPDMKKIPGVEMSTGSLGQGFSAAVGMAIAGKLDQNPGRVYALLGDGELQEGLIWEASMAAAHYKLDNLTAIVDWNDLQIDGKNDDVMMVTPVDEKFKSFGFPFRSHLAHAQNDFRGAFEEVVAFAMEYVPGDGSDHILGLAGEQLFFQPF
jgi:transketolase